MDKLGCCSIWNISANLISLSSELLVNVSSTEHNRGTFCFQLANFERAKIDYCLPPTIKLQSVCFKSIDFLHFHFQLSVKYSTNIFSITLNKELPVHSAFCGHFFNHKKVFSLWVLQFDVKGKCTLRGGRGTAGRRGSKVYYTMFTQFSSQG